MTRDELRELLLETADERGEVTRDGVVAAASDPQHPLHDDPHFLWGDDRAAAHEYRKEYAGRLIRRVYFVPRPVERRVARVPVFVRNPRRESEKEAGHVLLESVEKSSAHALIVVRDELDRATGALRRAAAVAGALEVTGADERLARLLAEVRTLQAQLTPPLFMATAARAT